MLAARVGTSCAGTTRINAENCRWRLNSRTRLWELVCNVASRRSLRIDTTALGMMRRDSSGVGSMSLRDSSGVGQMLAAPVGTACSSTVTINPENCYEWFDPQTQSWVLVCRIGSRLVIIDMSELTRIRRDSSGVGQ
jgi:hypothetical protein